MNAILGTLAAPAALDFTTQTVQKATTPFKLLLQAATQRAETTADAEGQEATADDAATLQERVARQLQDLLESLGVQSGEQATLRVDDEGDVVVEGHADASRIEAAINNDSELKADVQRLAEAEELFNQSPFLGAARLNVEVADEQAAAILTWR